MDPNMPRSHGEIKEAVCSLPILAYPQPGEEFIVDADASNTCVGGVFSQKPCSAGCNQCKELDVAEFGKPCRRTALKNDFAWEQKNLAAEQRQDPDLGPIIG